MAAYLKKKLHSFLFLLYLRYKRWRNNIHLFLIRLDRKVAIHHTVRISTTAKVEIRYSGFIEIGEGTEVWDHACIFSYGGTIKIGKHCGINAGAILYGHGGLTIGNHVLIAGLCMIIPNNHNFDDPTKTIEEQGNTSLGILIEDDVWIGHGCSILDGIIIGKGSVIAAGSVVNKSVPPYSVYGGVPAKFIKKRFLNQ